MKRWTTKELENTGDLTFAICILNERRNSLANPYSPLAQKLSKAVRTLEDIQAEQARDEEFKAQITRMSEDEYDRFQLRELLRTLKCQQARFNRPSSKNAVDDILCSTIEKLEGVIAQE